MGQLPPPPPPKGHGTIGSIMEWRWDTSPPPPNPRVNRHLPSYAGDKNLNFEPSGEREANVAVTLLLIMADWCEILS